MAITELKPYLTNLADAIGDKAFYPNLFNKDNLIISKTSNVSSYGPTDTGYYMVTSSSSSVCSITFDLGLDDNYEGKILTVSFKRNIDDDHVYASLLSLGNGVSPNYNNQYSSSTLDGENGFNTVSIPGSVTNSNAHLVLQLYTYELPRGTRVEFNDIMLTESSEPIEYTPYGQRPKINAQDFADKITEIYETGRYEQWSAFWDNLQQFGVRTDYNDVFKYYANAMYKPKHTINPIKADEMYSYATITDLSDINWDSGKLSRLYWTFSNCYILRKVGIIDLTGASGSVIDYGFYSCSALESITKIKVKEDGSQSFNNPFNGCTALKYVWFEGCIGKSLSFPSSSLTNECAKNILLKLKDYSGTSYEGTYKITFLSSNKNTLINEGATAPDGLTWDEYVLAKGWTW